MSIFQRGLDGAALGATMGGALGTIFAGVTLALPGVNIVVAPLMVAAAATTVTLSGTAAGTVVGGTAGLISGAREKRRGGDGR